MVVLVASATAGSVACAATPEEVNTPEYMRIVPPAYRLNPWQTMLLLARKRLQDIRCSLPQASLQGPLQHPKAEFCYHRNGLRICVSSRVSTRNGDVSGGLFVTNRPGECPMQ